MLQRKQVDVCCRETGQKDMSPISKTLALLWLKGMTKIFWFSKWAKIWFGLLSKKTACLSSRNDASSHKLGHCS